LNFLTSYLVIAKMEPRSMSCGTVFHLMWNKVPSYMEQSYKPLVTPQKHKNMLFKALQ